MTGRVVHFEIPFDEPQRVRAFYTQVFGWDLVPWDEDSGYLMASTGPTPEQGPAEAGFINGGLTPRDGSVGRAPVVVIDVEDIDATLARIEGQGGRPLREKEPVGDMGFAAYFEDSEGNVVGLWENATER
jgi:uncharacterized protein